MPKLFKFMSGLDEKYGIAEDEQDAYERRAEVDPTFDYTGCKIEEVVVPGYNIIVEPEGKTTRRTRQ